MNPPAKTSRLSGQMPPAILSALTIVAIGTAVAWFRPGMNEPLVGSVDSGSSQQYVKVGTDSVLRFVFPEPIEQASAREHLVIPEELEGDVEWDGDALVFRPSAPLEMGKRYAFTLSAGALRKDGRPLTKDFSFVFSVEGAPKAVSKIPAPDSDSIPTDAEITVVFDRPMVALASVYQQADVQLKDWKPVLSPDVPGSWQWLGTSTVKFTPSDGFVPATGYAVLIPAGFTNPAGDAIPEDIAWSFETQRPKILSTDPSSGFSSAGPDSTVTLRFNQEMNIDSLKPRLSLKTSEGTELDFRLSFDKTSDSTEDKTSVVMTPVPSLAFATSYAVTASDGIIGAQGDLGMAESYEFTFSTAKPLRVLKAHTQSYGVDFQLNNDLKEGDIKKYIDVSPEPEDWDDFELTIDSWSRNWLYVHPKLFPSTEYTFTLKAGLTDVFGQKLAADEVVTMTTPERDPRVFIHSKGDFGIFEKDKPPVYYLNALNVSNLSIDFAPLSLQQFISLQKSKRYDYDFSPGLSSYAGSKHWNIPHPLKELHNQWKSYEFDVNEQSGSPLSPGIYGLTLRSPEYKDWQGREIVETQYFALTDMAITLKYSGQSAFVWVTDVRTGDPVSGAEIAFHSLDNKVLVSGVTDAEGMFETDLDLKQFKSDSNDYDPQFWVTASKDGDMAFVGSDWNKGIRAYDFEYWDDFRFPGDEDYRSTVFMQTDRPIYRAGDEVHFKGIVRLMDDFGDYFVPLAKRSAQVRISDAQDKEVYNETLKFSEFGTFSDSFAIDGDGSLGTYSMNVTVLPDADIAYQYSSHSFEVRAYRKPEYKTSVTFSTDDFYDGDTVTAKVNGAYYFGAPMAGAKVRWRAMLTDFYFNRYTEGWYSFGDDNAWCWWNCERDSDFIAEGEGTLDEQGNINIQIPVSLEEKDLSQVLSLEADIDGSNNQTVSNRSSVVVHKSSVYVGVKPESYGVEPGSEARVKIITVNQDGTPASSRRAKVELFEREWNSVRKKGVDGEYYWDNEHEDTFVSELIIRTDEAGKALASVTVPEGGSYWLRATVEDDAGRESKAGTSLYAYSSTYFNWPHSNSDRFEIVADKPEYSVGDTAKLIAKSPYQGEGVKALVTVEREGIIKKFLTDVQSNALPIEIEVTEDMIPNAYVSVVVVKPRQGETFDDNGLDTGSPAFKTGLTRLKVETTPKNITLTVEPNKKKYLPSEKVDVILRAWDHQGNPVQADVSLSVVDMSVLALTGFQKPDLVAKFYSLRGLGVRTSQMLLYMLERFKPGSKGGGGGGEGDAQGRRDTFKDTAYWNPTIRTDASGEAKVSFTLPDNLTTWQLLAVANTKNSTFGSYATEIIETKEVIVQPLRPRFAVMGDEIETAAIIHNFTDEKRAFTVSLKGEGFTHKGKQLKSITIAPDAQAKVPFKIAVDSMESVTFNFTAESGDVRDEIEETIPVHLFSVPQSTATSGVVEDSVQETVYVPTQERALDLTLTTTVSPTVASYLPDGLEYVSTYPYGCAEQVMSSLLPNVSLKTLQGFDAFAFLPDDVLRSRIETGMQKLYGMQRNDGGFGYWPGSKHSYPDLTAYILYGMHLSKEAGHTVDSGVMSRARQYLDRELRKPPAPDERSISDAQRAHILFALAETGGADANLLTSLHERSEELPLFAKAFLTMAMQKSASASLQSKAEKLLSQIHNSVKVSPRGSHFEEENERSWRGLMNTNTRTTALVLMATVRGDGGNALLPRIVRYLLSVREEGHWDTTQSTSFTLLALTEYLRSTGELNADFTADVSVEGTSKLKTAFAADNILTSKESVLTHDDLVQEAMNAIVLSKQGEGLLYYDMLLSYVWLADELPPVERGMGVRRAIEPFETKGNSVFDSSSPVFVAGDTYKVTLTVTVPEDRHFVGVESPLPAGFEAIDTSLATTQQNLLQGELNAVEGNSWWDWWNSGRRRFTHTEFRDDRVFLFAEELPAGVYTYEYMVRATVPGTFHERPARAWEMYFPENFGQTGGSQVTVVDSR